MTAKAVLALESHAKTERAWADLAASIHPIRKVVISDFGTQKEDFCSRFFLLPGVAARCRLRRTLFAFRETNSGDVLQ